MKAVLSLILCLAFSCTLLCQSKYTISGYVEDLESGEKLITANVFDHRSGQGVVTNTYGFFSLTLSSDSIELTASYIGYQSQTIVLDLKANQSLNFRLYPSVAL